MTILTTSVLADTIPVILQKAMLTEQFTAIMPNFCWKIPKARHNGSTVNIPYFGIAVAVALTEGQDLASPYTLSDTLVTITPAEVGVQAIVTWKLARDNKEMIMDVVGQILGQAYGVKLDQDCLGQLADGTNDIGGGSTLTLGLLAAARGILAGNPLSAGGPCPGPYNAFIHPFTYVDIVDVVTPLVPTANLSEPVGMAGTVNDEIVRNFTVNRLFGMNIWEAGNIVVTSNDCAGGVIGPRSIILAVSEERDTFPEDDASLRATEINVVGEYGVGEYLAGWIVELSLDAATPA